MASGLKTLVVEVVDALAPELDAFLEHKLLIDILLCGSGAGVGTVTGLDEAFKSSLGCGHTGGVKLGLCLQEVHLLHTHNREISRSADLVGVVVALVRTELEVHVEPRPKPTSRSVRLQKSVFSAPRPSRTRSPRCKAS